MLFLNQNCKECMLGFMVILIRLIIFTVDMNMQADLISLVFCIFME